MVLSKRARRTRSESQEERVLRERRTGALSGTSFTSNSFKYVRNTLRCILNALQWYRSTVESHENVLTKVATPVLPPTQVAVNPLPTQRSNLFAPGMGRFAVGWFCGNAATIFGDDESVVELEVLSGGAGVPSICMRGWAQFRDGGAERVDRYRACDVLHVMRNEEQFPWAEELC